MVESLEKTGNSSISDQAQASSFQKEKPRQPKADGVFIMNLFRINGFSVFFRKNDF